VGEGKECVQGVERGEVVVDDAGEKVRGGGVVGLRLISVFNWVIYDIDINYTTSISSICCSMSQLKIPRFLFLISLSNSSQGVNQMVVNGT
jgi:hypothetical protein